MDDDLVRAPKFGAALTKMEINVLEVTPPFVIYEYSYTDKKTNMKKWAKRLAPLNSQGITQTYDDIIGLVLDERKQLDGRE